MPAVEVRLAELRSAATQFEVGAGRIRDTISTVNEIIDGVMAIGFGSPAAMQLALRYRAQRSSMEEWLDQLVFFSGKLEEAADELERAMSARTTPDNFYTRMARAVRHADEMYLAAAAAAAAALAAGSATAVPIAAPVVTPTPVVTPVAYPVDRFVTTFNQPVYNQLNESRQQLATANTLRAGLVERRDTIATELDALKDRLRSYSPNADLDHAPRVQAMQSQIDNLNGEITRMDERIDGLQERVESLTSRLERVKPGPGADLAFVESMVNSETPQIIRDSTEGCVQYMANRMPIPPGIAVDAYRWNEQADRYTQYGITQGNVPLQGAVLVMQPAHPYADDVYGHVMYVERVDPDGTVWITDHTHPYSPVKLSDLTTETSGPYINYLYFPWQTRA